MKKDVIIIGAGASGLMCAAEAGRRGRSVLVLDHARAIGKKLSISGGGRCNFTNLHACASAYLSENPHFCKSALARFTPSDFIGKLVKHGIEYIEKEDGQLFCRESSAHIINMLRKECRLAGAEMYLNCKVAEISKTDVFRLSANCGTFESKTVVIASGGLSYPSAGATDTGYRIAGQFGLKVTRLRPGLVPLLFSRADLKTFGDLSGISLDADVSCGGKRFRGNILFTHGGLSGPAILNISLYWNNGDEITIDLFPETDAYGLFMERRRGRVELRNFLSGYLPARFSNRFCELYADSRPLNQYTNKELETIARHLHNWVIRPAGTEGYNKAEVTIGGIDTDELSSKTMEAKKVPGLFFIGEVVDVTGQLGGYNLQWAWSSGYAAGQSV